MYKIKFEIKKEDTDETLAKRLNDLALRFFWELPEGKWEMVIRKPVRTQRQNKAIHAIFGDVAMAMEAHGITKNITIEARPTSDNLKVFFKEHFNGGKKTSKTNTKDLAENLTAFINTMNDAFEARGIGRPIAVKTKDWESLVNSQ